MLVLIIVFEKFFNRIGAKILFPLTVPETSPESDEETKDEYGRRTVLIPPATEGETPRGLEPAIPLHAMKFEEAEPIEPLASNEETDTNNGD